MVNWRDYNIQRARECLRRHEELDKQAGEIKLAWAKHFIEQRNRLVQKQRWWSRDKVEPLTPSQAWALADITCRSDHPYQKASKDAHWFMQQATMYAALAGVDIPTLVVPAQRVEASADAHSGK